MAHTYDTKVQFTTGSSDPTDVTYTCGSGATLLVLLIVGAGTTLRTGGNPTYNGVEMTLGDTNYNAETFCEFYYMLDPPTGSALTIRIQNDNARTIFGCAASFKAASGYTTQLRTCSKTSGTTANPGGPTMTGLATGDVIVSILGTGDNTFAPSAQTGTVLYTYDPAAYGMGSQYYITPDTADRSLTWTEATADDWQTVCTSFKEVAINYTLTMSNASLSSKSDNIVLAQQHTLAINNAAFTLTAANIALIEHRTLAINNASVNHAAENIVLIASISLVVSSATITFAAVPDIGAYEYEIRLFQAHTLAVQDAAHTLTSENVALFQAHTLSGVGDCACSHASESPALIEHKTLTGVADCSITHKSDVIALVENKTLSMSSATLGHSVENVVLEYIEETQVIPDPASFAVSAEGSIVLVQQHTLAVNDSAVSHSADNIALVPDWALVVDAAALAVTSENVTLLLTAMLEMNDASVSSSAENVTLVYASTLVVHDAALALTSGNIALAQQHLLAMNDASFALAATSPTLERTHVLAVDNVACALASASVDLFQAHTLSTDSASISHEAKNIILATPQMAVLEPDSAMFAITAHRIMMIKTTEELLHSVDMDPREYFQNADSRTYVRLSGERAYIRSVEPRMRP